ncbi:putative F-box protein [Acorus calamus]|uniref:F-box protein n=1 Tax=Acorus calamus TaxID=4465 RepID=A0AAV9CBK6_ACOCL|nr:putative F-box protein [Acorus calamus]
MRRCIGTRIWEHDLDRCIRTIFVKYIPMGTSEEDLKSFYEKYGPIVHIDLQPGKIQWMFAFVEFREPSAAQQARDLSDGTYIFDGHVMEASDGTVKSCIPETPYEYPMFTFASSNSSRGGVMASRDVVHYAFDSLPYCAEIPLEECFDGYYDNEEENNYPNDEEDEEDFYIYPGYVSRRRKGREPCDYDFVPISGYYNLCLRKLADMGHPVRSSYLEAESEQGTMTSLRTEVTRIPNLGIIVFTHPWHGFSLHYSRGGVGDLLDCKFSLSGLSDKLYRVSNSCDGLICVIGEKTAYVINPATKEFLELPSGTPHKKTSRHCMAQLGLYFDNETHEYKVVRLFRSEDGIGCEIFTLGGKSSSWRRIDNPPAVVHADPPIFVNGALHWTVAHNIYVGPTAIMSFDVQSEKFAIMMHPEDGAISQMERLRMRITLAVKLLGGHLCLVDKYIDYPDMDIWMLKDYANKHWVKMYTIDLGTIDGLNREMADFIWPEAICDNGTILFASLESRLEFYDPQSEVFQKFDIEVEGELQVQAYYTESQVSPHQPFFM